MASLGTGTLTNSGGRSSQPQEILKELVEEILTPSLQTGRTSPIEKSVHIIENGEAKLITKLCTDRAQSDLCKKGVFDKDRVVNRYNDTQISVRDVVVETLGAVYNGSSGTNDVISSTLGIIKQKCGIRLNGNEENSVRRELQELNDTLNRCSGGAGEVDSVKECYASVLEILKNVWYRIPPNKRNTKCAWIFDTCYNKEKAKKLFETFENACSSRCNSSNVGDCLRCIASQALLSLAAFQASMYGDKKDYWKVQWFIDALKYIAENNDGYFPLCAGNGDVMALLYLIIIIAKLSNIDCIKIKRNSCNNGNLVNICISDDNC